MDRNTYSLIFGKEPVQMISRSPQVSMISEQFRTEPPAQQVYMITGVRGSGKTVLMNEIQNRLKNDPRWFVAELSPERDMLMSLAAKMSSEHPLAELFRSAEINLSFFGFGLAVNNKAPITDIETAVSRMLETMKKHQRKVLITVDEAVNNQNVREFISSFQIFIRQDLPLFLIMTGLYENVYNLQNEKTLTFLYRAPKVEMKPLNVYDIADNYKKNFNLSNEESFLMAKETLGYPFAFQVLGYYTFEHQGNWREALKEYREYLCEYVYEKIWSEMSAGDRKLAYGIANSQDGKVSEIKEMLHMDTNAFNPYRQRLIRKGLIDGSRTGYVRFVLPMFADYTIRNYENEMIQ